MDNEAPNYAKWIPDLGGYVANGTVVSKTPQYDDQGKFKVDIDTTLFNQSKPSANTTQPQVANTLQGNVGVGLANMKGSGIDANAMTTGIGANTSLNLNTANPDESVLSTPATKSPVVAEPILSPEDKINKDYQDAAARGDYQGMINALIEKGNYDGQDYSTQIDYLTKQREQKIAGIDDQFLANYQKAKAEYDKAVRTGDENLIAEAQAKMDNVLAQQQQWRDAVGYDTAMKNAQQREEEEWHLEWESMYMSGVQQIADTLMQLTGNYLNFQYDPTRDASLRIAQGYVTSSVKEQAISTGTFGSSFMQSAIAKAVAELVPVYEKMAKEEMLQQISTLQSTASFLMNLEQTQFNMWKSQIELQWEANAEKRAQIKAAIDAANARGYYTNEEAALVGVEPGSLSQQAREHQQELQEELDREQRSLEQQKALAEYKNDLDIENYEAKQAIAAQYDVSTYAEKQRIASKYGTSTGGSSGTTKYQGMTAAQWKTYAKDYVSNGGDIEDIETELENSSFSDAQKKSIIEGAKTKESTTMTAGDIDWSVDELSGTMTGAKMRAEIEQRANEGELTIEDKVNMLENAVLNCKTFDEAWNAISTSQATSGGLKSSVFDSELLKTLSGTSKEKLYALDQYYTALAYGEEYGENPFEIFQTLGNTLVKKRGEDGPGEHLISADTVTKFENAYIKNEMFNDIEFDTNRQANANKVDKAIQKISNNIRYMDDKQIVKAYESLFDTIDGAGKDFEFNKPDVKIGEVLKFWGKDSYDGALGGAGDKSKEHAMLYILNDLYRGTNPVKGKQEIVKEIAKDFKQRAMNYKNGYSGLKNKNNYAV